LRRGIWRDAKYLSHSVVTGHRDLSGRRRDAALDGKAFAATRISQRNETYGRGGLHSRQCLDVLDGLLVKRRAPRQLRIFFSARNHTKRKDTAWLETERHALQD